MRARLCDLVDEVAADTGSICPGEVAIEVADRLECGDIPEALAQALPGFVAERLARRPEPALIR